MSDQEKKASGLEKLTTSWLGRSARASKLALNVGARMTAGALSRVFSDGSSADADRAEADKKVGAEIVASLGQLKGALMKVGQMFSYMDLALPDSWREVMKGLQDSTVAMAPEVARKVVEEELGAPPESVFAEWSPEPFSAASIGQVHKAKLKSGEAVAVKVQYPGIAEALSADLSNAAVLGTLGRVITQGVNTRAIVGELRERLMAECDYEQEARNQDEMRQKFAGDPDCALPRVYFEFTRRRVLTTELIEAQRFHEFVAGATQERKNWAGAAINRFAFQSIFRHLCFNCDPHPGNYLFKPDKVVFLDFGCMKRFDAPFVEDWKRMIRAALERDRPTFDALVVKTALAKDPAKFDFDAHYRAYLHVIRPWLTDQEFHFTHAYVTDTFRRLISENPNKLRTNVPPEFVFANRLQWGLYAVLATLDATAPWRAQILPLLYAPGEKTPPPFTPAELAAFGL